MEMLFLSDSEAAVTSSMDLGCDRNARLREAFRRKFNDTGKAVARVGGG